jgi:hypothetical protein
MGLVYSGMFLILNAVIIVNLVIAILSTTYEEFVQYKRGLYYDNIVAIIPRFKNNKYYGSMTCALGPFAIV